MKNKVGGVRLINLTPHEVKVLDDEGKVIATFPSEGVIQSSVKKTQWLHCSHKPQGN